MALVDDIRDLRDRALADLRAAHDYYVDTCYAWRIVRDAVQSGQAFSFQNSATGTVTTQSDLADRAQGYVKEQLAEATVQQFISVFEAYVFDLHRLWLTAYPGNLIGRKVDYKDVLEAADKDEVTLLVVNKELNEILYRRPADWLAYLEERAKLGRPAAEEVARFSEAKACRDVMVHSRGVAGKSYKAKAGRLARCRAGERVDVSERYRRETWELLCAIVADTADAALVKLA